jgi:SAM-dependent methyltransferase
MHFVRKIIHAVLPQTTRCKLRQLYYYGSAEKCPLCGANVRQYIGHGRSDLDILQRRKVVGGLRRENDQCPACRSADRTRLMMLYLRKAIDAAARKGGEVRVLHVAPELGLYMWFERKGGLIRYTGTDLDAERYRHIRGFQKADITAMPFGDNTFDFVICSHVLEHIPDDRKAMQQILRVLKPGGEALLMVPLATDGLGTDEEPSIHDPLEQERRFGQWDHVRLYSREDFQHRLAGCGFDVLPFNGYEDSPEEAKALHLNPEETLVVSRKPVVSH